MNISYSDATLTVLMLNIGRQIMYSSRLIGCELCMGDPSLTVSSLTGTSSAFVEAVSFSRVNKVYIEISAICSWICFTSRSKAGSRNPQTQTPQKLNTAHHPQCNCYWAIISRLMLHSIRYLQVKTAFTDFHCVQRQLNVLLQYRIRPTIFCSVSYNRVVSNTGKSIAITIAILSGKSIAILIATGYFLQRNIALQYWISTLCMQDNSTFNVNHCEYVALCSTSNSKMLDELQ